jgi:C-terminal processing protease CtpA/Prc
VGAEPQVLSALPPNKLEVSTYSPPTSQTNGHKVGVGLLLAYSRNGQGEEVEVSDIIPAFSAAESNQFDVGDVVLSIDGISVRRMPLAEVKKLTIGEVGTTVQFIMRSHTEVSSFVAKPLS